MSFLLISILNLVFSLWIYWWGLVVASHYIILSSPSPPYSLYLPSTHLLLKLFSKRLFLHLCVCTSKCACVYAAVCIICIKRIYVVVVVALSLFEYKQNNIICYYYYCYCCCHWCCTKMCNKCVIVVSKKLLNILCSYALSLSSSPSTCLLLKLPYILLSSHRYSRISRWNWWWCWSSTIQWNIDATNGTWRVTVLREIAITPMLRINDIAEYRNSKSEREKKTFC